MRRDSAHGGNQFRGDRLRLRAVGRCERDRGKCALQCAHCDGAQTVALIDDFALLGQAQDAPHRAIGQRLDQMFGPSAAARRRAAASMEYQ